MSKMSFKLINISTIIMLS